MRRLFFRFALMLSLFAATLISAPGQTARYDLVFTSSRDGNAEIYAMRADGGGQINLSNSPTTLDAIRAGRPTARASFIAATAVFGR